MKIEIKNEILIKIIEKISHGLNTRNIIESLNGIKIIAKKDYLKFITSRQDLSIEYTLTENFTCKEEGEVVIPSKFLKALFKDNSNAITTISCEGGSGLVKLVSQFSEINACTYNLANYPQINFTIENQEPIQLSAKQFRSIYKATQHSASMVKDYQYFMGIHYDFDKNTVIASSTDSRRLSIIKLPLTYIANDRFTINKELIKIINELINNDDELKIYHEDNQLLISFSNYKVKLVVIPDNYPNLEDLIITAHEIKYKFIVNKNNLFPILEKIEELNKNVLNPNVTFNFEDNMGIITSEFQDFGNLKEKFLIENIEGKAIPFTLEPKFLLQALRALEDDLVEISVKDEISPILLHNVNNLTNLQEISPIKR